MFQKHAGGIQLLDPKEILEKVAGLGYGDHVGGLGCGPKAYFVFQAARIVGDRGLVYAVDIQKDVLSSVESHVKTQGFSNVRTIWSNLETYGATKIPESSLDLAMFVNVLFESSDVASMLKEGIRLTKKSGKILVVDWKAIGAPLGPKPEHRIKPSYVKEILEAYGLKLESEFDAGQYHFGLLFRK